MSRTGYLVAAALIFALAAAGVLVWTNVLDLPGRPTVTSEPATGPAPKTATSPSAQAQLVTVMTKVAANGGFAATFSEKDVRLWKIAAGHQLERFSLEPADAVIARLTSSTVLGTPTVRWEDLGLSVTLPGQFSKQYQGRQIEVGIIARMPIQNASNVVSVVFATQQTGNSGWNSIQLSNKFELHTVTWRIPPVEGGYHARPIVVVHADATGGGRAVELLGVYVKPL